MKISIVIAALLLLYACAPFQEAYYVDREFGKESQAAWDQQIIDKKPDTEKVPEGIAGISAEEIMNVHNKTFAEKPKKSALFEFDMGQSK